MSNIKSILFALLFLHSGTVVFSQNWLIASDYKVGQKLPLRLLYPRPDAETPNNALHRKASSNWTYQTRICIQGGEAPFKYEIVSGPSTATIVGEMNRTIDPITGLIAHNYPDGYATVSWPNPSGTGNFNIKVTDQSGATTNAIWTVQTDETAFVVLDQVNGNDANTGTWNSPLASIPTGLWRNSDTDATFANKIAVFKRGTYPVYGRIPNTNCAIDPNIKPRSFLAVESDVVFNMNNGHFFVNTGDVAFVGMEFRGSRTDQENNRIIQISTKNSNYLFWKLKFSNQTFGTSGTDNPSCIVFLNGTTFTQNVAIVDCEVLPTASMQLVVTYTCDGVLLENNKFTNVYFPSSNGSAFFHVKGSTKNQTIRFNHLTGEAPYSMIRMNNNQVSGLIYNQEICYNYIQSNIVAWESGPIIWNLNTTYSNPTNIHTYRNTIIAPNSIASIRTEAWNGGENVKLSANAWVATNFLFSYSGGSEEVLPQNVKLLSTDFDADGKLNNLTGKRSLYAGKLGFEILSTPTSLSVAENDYKLFTAYPNPSINEAVTIDGLDPSEDTVLKIIDVQGKVLHQSEFKSNQYKIDQSIFPLTGIYIVQLRQNSKIETLKIIVQ
ncbi:T9SS type A sorting domain-containing protein [Flavobacterium polysaccharolyticum]|uniref:T9SS type A sorting domain-containing protein n=1 Tax=Flavobacterium polysaccharolyticum TaxID=3133148 RepID=A0ABU9NST7_9FLAO